MIAMLGRRRVGKTYLIDQVYKDHIIFKQTGARDEPEKKQIKSFAQKIETLAGEKLEEPEDWMDVFFMLRRVLEKHVSKEKKLVIFLDELSWFTSEDSKSFLNYLGYFWNDWAYQQNLAIVLCGSATSWIIQKVINDKGGLHNRVTRYIHLEPFNLAETEEYLEKNTYTRYNRYDTTRLYMALGGIPAYLKEVKHGKGVIQNINDICFAKNAPLKNEFSRLYPALFEKSDHHVAVIRALASKHSGMTRTEIIQTSKIPNGSTATRILEELEQCNFIFAHPPLGKKKKDKIYRLIDEYSLFYLRFIEHTPYTGEDTFMQLSQRQPYKIWCGYAFENICMKHIYQIKKVLGVAGVHTTTYSFYKRPDEWDDFVLQIDMLMERADNVLHLFEIKFRDDEFVLNIEYADKLDFRKRRFVSRSKTRRYVINTLITPFGMKKTNVRPGTFGSVLTLDDLFLPVNGKLY